MDFSSLVSPELLAQTADALRARGFETHVVASRADALRLIVQQIPSGASVMNGSSRTLDEIGFISHLKSGAHSWHNLHDTIIAEKDPGKQGMLRVQSVISDYYLGSAHAVTQEGELLVASAMGSQLPHLAFTSQNIILVVGAQKVVPSIAAGLERIERYVVPLEDERMKQAYGYGTVHSKTLILHREPAKMGRKFTVILVDEKLGF